MLRLCFIKQLGGKMRLIKADIKNFRKLKNCSLSFSADQTILVGANNSGKTSAIKAFKLFLYEKGASENFKYTDFTFDNWNILNQRANTWFDEKVTMIVEEELREWQQYCPTMDLNIEVMPHEIHHVIDFLPSLDWDGGLVGLRFRLEPKNIEELRADFVSVCNENKRIIGTNTHIGIQDIWPNNNIQEFLSRYLDKYFKVKSYVIDPLNPHLDEISLEKNDALKGLIKVSVIDDDAGFFNSNGAKDLLSNIIQKYYKTHFENDDRVKTENDLRAIKAVNDSKIVFDSTLAETFSKILEEVKELGYPGSKNDPNISISSKINQIESLGHEGAIRFKINNDEGEEVRIPEALNGLGFRRLISITLELINFRESWLRTNKLDQASIEPLHLVLIEEPEAHLHAQVQQVFIKKAHDTLCLDLPHHCNCQLLVSTHSSYLAKELDFSNLRYFKRKNNDLIPHAEVIDLSKTFEESVPQNSKFVTRYIQTTHCDLFFANGVILVEGDAERLLVPHFIKSGFKSLNQSYISILSVGGAHAHRLRNLIEKLDLPCLVITDLDSVKKENVGRKNKESFEKIISDLKESNGVFTEYKSIFNKISAPDLVYNNDGSIKMVESKTIPDVSKGLLTNNTTLRNWVPKLKLVDELLFLEPERKIDKNTRVCFQTPIDISFKEEIKTVYPYTFEESIYFENLNVINNQFTTKKIKNSSKVRATGVLYKMLKAEENDDFNDYRSDIFAALEKNKVDMAMDLIYGLDPQELQTPQYIKEGLEWLQKMIIGTVVENEKKVAGDQDVAA